MVVVPENRIKLTMLSFNEEVVISNNVINTLRINKPSSSIDSVAEMCANYILEFRKNQFIK